MKNVTVQLTPKIRHIYVARPRKLGSKMVMYTYTLTFSALI